MLINNTASVFGESVCNAVSSNICSTADFALGRSACLCSLGKTALLVPFQAIGNNHPTLRGGSAATAMTRKSMNPSAHLLFPVCIAQHASVLFLTT